ncbi:MAG: hypothetical protein J5565_01385 [Muribaculaceae bacterium]|nr:hypothetical protein [Muribaculaceae bacterium]
MNQRIKTNIGAMLVFAAMTVGMSSCASLFGGNPNCHCTHPGPCVCCETGVVVGHQNIQRDTVADDSLLSVLLDLSKYELKSYLPEEPQRIVWLDDTIHETQEELMSGLKFKDGQYMPIGVTTSNSDNAIYFCFKEQADGTPEPLRLRIQYYADDPLQYYEAVFNINGFEYRFKPEKINRGKEKPKFYWENSDDAVKAVDKDLVYALSHGQWGEMILLASNGIHHRKALTEAQIKDFYNVLHLYLLKGGKID